MSPLAVDRDTTQIVIIQRLNLPYKQPRSLASGAIGERGDAGAPFAARNEVGLFKSARLEASADLLGLASEDARKNKVTAGEQFLGESWSGSDEQLAKEIRKDDVGAFEAADLARVGYLEFDFVAVVRMGVFFRDSDAYGIKIKCLDRRGAQFFSSDGENSSAGARIHCSPTGGKFRDKVAEEAQAGRCGGVIAGSKGHARRNEDRIFGFGGGFPGSLVRVDFETVTDGERRAGRGGIVRPGVLFEQCHLAAEGFHKMIGCFFIRKNLDFQRGGFGFGEHDEVLGVDEGESGIPVLLHALGA